MREPGKDVCQTLVTALLSKDEVCPLIVHASELRGANDWIIVFVDWLTYREPLATLGLGMRLIAADHRLVADDLLDVPKTGTPS